MSIPNSGFVSDSFSTEDLINIFPVTQYYYYNFEGNSSQNSHTFQLTQSYSVDTYAVFTSIYYGYGTSGPPPGTYNQFGISSGMGQIVISDITSSTFTINFDHTTGNNINIYIVCMVVFNSSLSYDKSY